jgi:formylglycine-generating enzyme required for sulfatase activity
MKKNMLTKITLAALCFVALAVTSAHADTFGSGGNTFTIGFVPIGNAGNASDTWFNGIPQGGAVPYNFNMSTFAISQDQIVKATASGAISLGGGAWVGSQPAANVTWYQAAAFVNYLNTSKGHAPAYNLDAGATTLTLWSSAQAWQAGGENLYRNKDAYYFLPSENEYYKAAYYDPNKVGGAGYWRYATGSDTAPTPVASGTTAGTAVYKQTFGQGPAAVNSAGGLSPYGTMGQTGNVWEWQETAIDRVNNSSSENRKVVGGAWFDQGGSLFTPPRATPPPPNPPEDPSLSDASVGFRVASVPEPSAVVASLLGLGVLAARRRRQRA